MPCLALHCLAWDCIALPCLALSSLALPCITWNSITWNSLAWNSLALPCLELPCLALPGVTFPRIALPCTPLCLWTWWGREQKIQKLAGQGGTCLYTQVLLTLRQENCLNLGGRGAVSRLCHCTPAWCLAIEWDSVSKNKNKNKQTNKKTETKKVF